MASASSSAQSSILELPTTHGIGQRNNANVLFLSVRFSSHQKSDVHGVQVKCMGEEKLPGQPTPVAFIPLPPPAPQAPPPAPKAKKVSTKFSDVLAFGGLAPERINGRLAMIGFVAAIAAELAKGDDVVSRIANRWLPWFVGTSLVLSVASLIPLFNGVSVESKSKGFMTS